MVSSTGLGQVSCKLAATMLTTTDTLSQQCQVSTSLSTLDTVSQQVSTMWSELSSFPCQDTDSAWGRCQAVVRISEGRRRWRGEWWQPRHDLICIIPVFVSSSSSSPPPHHTVISKYVKYQIRRNIGSEECERRFEHRRKIKKMLRILMHSIKQNI